MNIGCVQLELRRTGDTAKLRLTAKPFSHETPITLDELEALATEFAHQAMDWRQSRNHVTVDCYTVLGVPRDASAEEIQHAYRTRAKQDHPDTSAGSTAAMQQLNEAYAVLGDPQQRQQYDRTMKGGTT